MNGAEYLVRALEAQGVKTIFGYPGGAILPFYDALVDSSLRHILVRHEQAAAIAADGWARVTGEVGVCVATSGPGATNLLTGIANAYMDSVPMVALTGQVPTELLGTDAFQELDVIGLTMPIVKHSALVRRVEDLPELVEEAFRLAREGRPGPVLLDLPKDVMNAALDAELLKTLPAPKPAPPTPEALARACQLLSEARAPLAYVGGGVRLAEAVAPLREFLEVTGMPSAQTLKALGSVPVEGEVSLGMLGMHGLKAANLMVQACDLLVCIGARFDDRVTGALKTFAPEAKVIHLDIDPAEVGKRRQPEAPVVGDLHASLKALTMPLDIEPWRQRCAVAKVEHAWDYEPPSKAIYGPRFLRELGRCAQRAAAARADSPQETFITCDVGQHQMWVAQHYPFSRPEHHLTSGGLGTMGYGLPAAIGAQLARPDARVINVTGDGSIMMNVQELATVVRYKLPIKVVVLDNQCLGMVRQWQDLFLGARHSEVDLSDNPDFVLLARAFGFDAFRVDAANQVDGAIARLLYGDGPQLVHVVLDNATQVWPLVPPGRANHEMMEGVSL